MELNLEFQEPPKSPLLAKSLWSFVESERCLYADDDENRVSSSLGQVGRYLEFLDIIVGRYRVAAKVEAGILKRRLSGPLGTRSVSEEEFQQWKIDAKNNTQLQLEIESFLQFAKILLDKTAHFIEDYFGSVRKTSLFSHHEWCKSREKYVAAKQLAVPAGLAENMQALQSLVSDYRDKKITHLQHPRVSHGVAVGLDGKAQINVGFLYPVERDEHWQSPTIEEICEKLVAYIDLVKTLITTNRDKSRFRLK